MTFSIQKDRIYAVAPDGSTMGSVSFPRVRAGLVNISQMTVLPAFRHQGLEDVMMEALLSYLDCQGLKAALTCPYAQQYVEQNPQWKKILPGQIHFTKY